ncbi:hypothetical protein BD410DRAFT_115702 [Rickenella mellea]|uniref:Uncharacterized protein n=1 Tax=Rickenella mellea TaxID=50990 RepID=A0A4Y7QBT3_9AGAM|nr:hypothetical protein BD410DRAFT_115702 [Rickenella mellea]
MNIFGGWTKSKSRPTTPTGADSPVENVNRDESNPSVEPLGISSSDSVRFPSGAQLSPSVSADTALLSPPSPTPRARKFSFRSLGFFYGHQGTMPVEEDHKEKVKVKEAPKRASISLSRSDKRAKEAAITLRTVIIGHDMMSPDSGALKAKPVTKPQLKKVKSQLMHPSDANKVIAQLRALPMPDGPVVGKTGDGTTVVTKTGGPIHAVCLEQTDAEVDELHFSKLAVDDGEPAWAAPSVTDASLKTLVPVFNDLRIVSLLKGPDFGFGQPGDGDGILSGAVPTAETVINGVMQVTPQLLALGFATGRAVLPDHAGVYPPLDRISVITYWWGLEIVLPPPTMSYLDKAKSISTAVLNLLTALSLVNNGVREILPFIRYISQFLDFEWTAIKGQDKGKGVVCAATWIMPAAMVPRPWDFPDPPSQVAPPPLVAGGDKSGDENAKAGMLPSLLVTPATLPRKAGLYTTPT